MLAMMPTKRAVDQKKRCCRDLYCRFTFTGSKGSVRAVIETLTSGGTATAALSAS
jgi:hypothetical protein